MLNFRGLRRPILILVIASFATGAWANLTTVQRATQSRYTLVELMADPAVAKAYRQMQYDLLNTRPDSDLRDFFEGAQGIGTAFASLGELQEQLIADFLRHAEISMYRVNQNSPGKMGFLHEAFVQTALDLGFSKDAIGNSRIYITYGNVNAFTISGSDNAIVVVVQSELLEKLSLTEVNSVLAHELGHIRSKHTSVSIVARILLNVGLTVLTKGEAALVGMRMRSEDMVQELKNDPRLYCSYSHDHKHPHQHSLAEHVFGLTRSDQLLNQIVTSVLSLPPQILMGATFQFFAGVRENATLLELPPETTNYLDQILTLVQNDMSELRLNSDVFKIHAEVLLNALSRAKEKSADHYAGAILPNEIVASAFGKLMGANFSPQDRERLFADIQDQVRNFNESHSFAERAMAIGGSHPPLAIRVNDILSIEKYPNVAIAHPFLRFFMIRDHIWTMRKRAKTTIAAGENTIASLAVNQELSEPQKTAVKAQLEELVLQSMQVEEEMTPALPLVEERIFELITSLGFAKRNPRVENMIQLLSYQRELAFFEIQQLGKMIESETNEEIKKVYEAQVTYAQSWLQRPTAVVDRVLAVVENVLSEGRLDAAPEAKAFVEKYRDLLLELKAVNSMEAGEALRAKITNFNKRTSLPRSADPERCAFLLAGAA